MQGRITKFNERVGHGIIVGEDGSKYRFAKSEVMNLNGRLVGYEVDFLLNQRRAADVVLMTGTPWNVFSGSKH